MAKQTPKSPGPNKRAFQVVQEATEDEAPTPEALAPAEKNPAAVALGRLGGKKGWARARREAKP